jgi:leucyl-tRNA synthetase
MLDAPWPEVDEDALKRDEVELMLQINGKLRGSIVVAAGASKDEIERLAIACELVQKQADGGAIKRVIVVPGRLVNVVL